MADFLLVHGSSHGAWCWRDLIAELTARGHHAGAIDLPGHGQDTTPARMATLEGCANAVLAACRPGVVVVGHSWGGYPISAAAEIAPGAMRSLVYLCAYVPVSGLSMGDMRKRAPRQPILDAVIRNPDGLTISIDADKAADLFYNDCAPEIVDYAVPRLCPQAIAPQATPLVLSDRWAGVPKSYIRCTGDRTIPPEYQAEMVRHWPRDRVHDMPTSHSPFFSDPAGLADLLIRIAEED